MKWCKFESWEDSYFVFWQLGCLLGVKLIGYGPSTFYDMQRQREECGVPEGIASIPWRSSCPLTGTCEMSSFSYNSCDVSFIVNGMYGGCVGVWLEDCRMLWCRKVNGSWRVPSFHTYLLTYLLTHSMEQSPSSEANRSAASQEIPRI
jgi:hypothetical protein